MRTIYIDFDGTIVEHKFPEIGKPVPHAFEVIRKLKAKGHDLVLNTMRSEIWSGINEVLDYCKENGCEFEYWSTNKRQPINWSLSMASKTGNIYIDDETTAIPLMPTSNGNGWMVDWKEVESRLLNHGIL